MQSDSKFAVIILAAGQGTRMASDLPKVLHKIAHRPMIQHVVRTAEKAGAERIVLVTAPGMDAVRDAAKEFFPPMQFATQSEQRGTGHAVQCAMAALDDFHGRVVILYGDTPLIRAETVQALLEKQSERAATIALLGMQPEDPTGYGRLVMAEDTVTRIVECKDANAEEKKIRNVWSGVMAVEADFLREALPRLTPSEVTREYYLTALVQFAHEAGKRTAMASISVEEAMGVNDRAQLAAAEKIAQTRLRMRAMKNGATLIAPETVFLAADSEFGRDCILHPHIVIGPGVRLGARVEVRSFSHLEGASVSHGAVVGPFARLRPGARIGEYAHIGNFVEIKNSTLGQRAKASHLSYIGDATVGDGANIGAGTITCNYDGYDKYKTEIGAGAFIGSNTALVAPVSVGAGAIIGAGSVITTDVGQDALSFTRAEQTQKNGWAQSFRARKKGKK